MNELTTFFGAADVTVMMGKIAVGAGAALVAAAILLTAAWCVAGVCRPAREL